MPQSTRTSNPALGRGSSAPWKAVLAKGLRFPAPVNKTGILVPLCVASAAWTWSSFFRPHPRRRKRWRARPTSPRWPASADSSSPWSPSSRSSGSPITALIYALLEGLLLGGARPCSRCASDRHRDPGCLADLRHAYRHVAGRIPLGPDQGDRGNLRLGIVAATGASSFTVPVALSFFGFRFNAINGSGPIGIIFSLVVGVARDEPGARL